MELPTQEGDMPLPLNTSYGGGHIIHHDPISPLSTQIPSNGPTIHHNHSHHHEHVTNFKKIVKYRECLKNHAATMGGNATDGCGEFMPSGEEGSIEALTCSACNCHRNFHRKEVEGETQQIANTNNYDGFYHHHHHHHNVNSRMVGRKVFVGHHHKGGYLGGGGGGPEGVVGYHHAAAAARGAVPPHQMIMSYNHVGSLPSDQSEEEGGVGGGGVRVVPSHLVKKRFRTKFTQEQKEKMLDFAERVGWKIQKQEEGVVQQFCQEVGVKRRVLKVWMHNNKHSLGKKNSSSSNNHHDDQGVNVVVVGGENQD